MPEEGAGSPSLMDEQPEVVERQASAALAAETGAPDAAAVCCSRESSPDDSQEVAAALAAPSHDRKLPPDISFATVVSGVI